MRKAALIVAGAALASCAHGPAAAIPPVASGGGAYVPQIVQPLGGGSLHPLYGFQNGKDGANPYAGLLALKGDFYGTTMSGGTSGGWGTVFRVNAMGKEYVLYRFKANNDGATPLGGLIELGGDLYGTTQYGGTSGAGTVFRITTTGKEHVLYSFKGGANDGEYPEDRLVALNGELYGTTNGGGVSPGWGVVFKVSTAGVEHVLYKFKANDDGAAPIAGVTSFDNVLYGTTSQGGTHGSGTVYRITTAGSEKVLYSFKGGLGDGQYPYARLVGYKGDFYGTTYQGGVAPGWGVVFRVTRTGAEHVLYKFKANNDGAHPQLAGLISLKNVLYGTTYQGGTSGYGTIYSITPAGKEHVVYSFAGTTDGGYPYDGLIAVKDALYGTTNVAGSLGYGTVFRFTP